MPIRDLLIALTVFATLPFCFFRPWIGILVWSWLAYMNPHRYAWGFAYAIPFAQLVALAVIAGLMFTKERKPFLWTYEVLALVALWAWFTTTTIFALYPEDAWEKWTQFSKIMLMNLIAVPLFQDRRKFRLLLVVIALSLAFYGVKGGIFTLATGGHWMVLGPPDTFFSGNTEIALVLNMALPLFVFLAREEERRWFRVTLRVAFVLTAVAVLFTYSRGGLLGLGVVLAVLFLRAKAKVALSLVGVLGAAAFLWFTPGHWFSRMETIETYQQDASAQLRLTSWRVAYQLAADRPTVGGGFRVFTYPATYIAYGVQNERAWGQDAHSIYFNILGEHGWVGLAFFLLLIGVTFDSLRRLRKVGRTAPQLQWVTNYANMLQASILGYLATGVFLSVAYFDLAYNLIVLVPILRALAAQELAPAPKRPEGAVVRSNRRAVATPARAS